MKTDPTKIESCLFIDYTNKNLEVIIGHVDFISSSAPIAMKGDSSIPEAERRIEIIDCAGESPTFDVSALDSISIECLSVSNSSEMKFCGGKISIVGMRIDSNDKERVELRSDSITIERMDFKQISSGEESFSADRICQFTILKSMFTGENRTRINALCSLITDR